MNTHLALLRGINVSGHKMINMVAFKKALEAELNVISLPSPSKPMNPYLRFFLEKSS